MEEDYEVAYSILSDYDFIGMEEKLDEIVLSFEETKWNDSVQDSLEREFAEALPNAKISEIEILPDRNWNEEWEKNVQPVVVSENLVITPEWKADGLNYKHKIIINPKMSFGTGQHSTTFLMSKMIEKLFAEKPARQREVWIDAGTGTGVLAIIAAEFGVSKILAFDNDDWAKENAEENILLNGKNEQISVSQSSALTFNYPSADCIVANMYIGIITECFPHFYKALRERKGTLLVSGILMFDRDLLLQRAEQSGFKLAEETQDQEWCCFRFGV